MFSGFILEELYNKYENKIDIDLSSACMPAMSLNDLLQYYSEKQKEKFLDSILNTKLSYSTQYGTELTRDSIIKNLYAGTLKPNNILLSSGASEAIYLIMCTLFEPGDSIIVQQPIYQSLYQIAADHGVQVTDWNLNTNRQSHWDISELQNLIKTNPGVKALVINNPNSPTGLGFKREELKQIAELLNGRYLISDEVFLPLSQSQLPSTLEIYENSIVICDLSKSFNMPGLRLGWIATHSQDILKSCSSLKNYLSLRTNTLSELITPWVLEKHSEIARNNREIIKANIEHLYSINPNELFFDLTIIPQNSIEGLCIFPYMKDEALVSKLWQEQNIFVVKGEIFGKNWGKHLRIGLGQRLAHLIKFQISSEIRLAKYSGYL